MVCMRTVLVVAVCVGLLPSVRGQELRRLPVREYRDKMKAGWIGQIIGVSWGAPTEGALPADHAGGQDACRSATRWSTTPSARTTSTSR